MPEEEFEILDDNADFDEISDDLSPEDNVIPFDRNRGRQKNNSLREKIDSNKKKMNNSGDTEEKSPKKRSNKLNENSKKQDTGEKSLSSVRGKQRQFNSGLGKKKDNEEAADDSNKKDNTENKEKGASDNKESENKQDKNPINKIKNKFENAKDVASNPAKLIKTVAKKIVKTTIRLAMALISPLIIGILLALFVIYLILGPLMEVWEAFDQGVTTVANSVEKFTNFYRGFGFQDSKSAFFDEVNELQKFYDNQLDLPLLMSTLFYTEQDGYNSNYESVETPKDSDPISSFTEGGLTNLVSFFKSWVKDKVKETYTTTDENGLAYTAGKIYRLRRLAAAMCDRSGPSTTMGLSDFLDKFCSMLGDAIKDAILAVFGSVFDILTSAFEVAVNTIVDVVTLDWDSLTTDWEKFADDIKNTGENIKYSIQNILNILSFGLCTITSVKFSLTSGLSITYIPHKINVEKYDDYLRGYYIENTYEFKKYLTKNEDYNKKRIEEIIRNIHTNEEAFREIVLNELHGTSEVYADGCVGAIDNSIISSLRTPVDIQNSSSMYFDENTTYGIVNGLKHNGVDLNNSNAGIKEGDNVYAIADGKVESVGESSSVSSSNIDNYLFIGDSRYAGISHKLKNYGSNVTVLGVVSSNPNDWLEVVKNGSGSVRGNQITLPTSVSNISIMLGVNDLSQDSQLQDIINTLHSRYPSAIIYVNSVYNTGKSYSGYATNSKIKEFNDKMKAYCESNSSYAKYIDVTNGLNDSDGYLNSSYSDSPGLHLNEKGQDILVGNIISMLKNETTLESGGITIKLSHNLSINNKTYKFYSVYSNLDKNSVTLKANDTVSKASIIGKIGKTDAGVSQLHFEFRNESDTPIDPTNLFIPCHTGTQLAGNTNEEKIANALLAAGFNYIQVASVMANIYFESSYTSTAINGLGCTGISQWCFERQLNLTNYANSKNVANTDLQTQITFLLAELKNEGEAVPYASANNINIEYYKGVIDAIRDYQDVNLATEYYCNYFENPGSSDCAERKASGKGSEWYRILTQ